VIAIGFDASVKLPTTRQIGTILEFLSGLKRPDFDVGQKHGLRKGENGVTFLKASGRPSAMAGRIFQNSWMGVCFTRLRTKDEESLIAQAGSPGINRQITPIAVRSPAFRPGLSWIVRIWLRTLTKI
jgi:hypothetical protein